MRFLRLFRETVFQRSAPPEDGFCSLQIFRETGFSVRPFRKTVSAAYNSSVKRFCGTAFREKRWNNSAAYAIVETFESIGAETRFRTGQWPVESSSEFYPGFICVGKVRDKKIMAGEKKYFYLKYPYAKNGWYSLVLASVSLVITVTILVLSIVRNGGMTEFLSACGFTALIMSIMGLWFSFLALGEREKNYLFAFIGGGVSLLLAVCWVVLIIHGNP